MFGSYTPFEVEAERRREVLADSMRDARGSYAPVEEAPNEPTPEAAADRRSRADVLDLRHGAGDCV
jgi:hypothetical protein